MEDKNESPLHPVGAKELTRMAKRNVRTCDDCGGQMTVEHRAVRRYELGGLPHVELHGVAVARCATCGAEEMAIPRIEQLHRVLASHFIRQSRAVTSTEVRFLRKHIGLATADFAKCMGVSRETVSRWETGTKPMGAQADRLLRLLVATSAPIHDYAAKDVLRAITPSRSAPKRPSRFAVQASPDGWRP